MCVCVGVCVRACVRACVRVCENVRGIHMRACTTELAKACTHTVIFMFLFQQRHYLA